MRSPKQPAKLAMLLLLVLLLFCSGVGNVHCSTIHENRVDLQALLDFQQGIASDPRGALSNWNTTTHFCHWNAQLKLSGWNLAGLITSSLGNLTFLSHLDLSGNNFVGPLPVIGHLQQLDTFPEQQ
ncbi:hypothetical protein VPH35_105107 [Triticum aestivum]